MRSSIQGPVPEPPALWSWEELIQLALEEAFQAYAENEVPVGALIVSAQGIIISKAHNEIVSRKDACAHAEILALRKASKKLSSIFLSDCVLIVTLEPCLLCASAISLSRLNGVVFGARDKHAGAFSSNNDFINLPLNYKSVWHMGGVAEQDCQNLLKSFFKNKR